MKSPCVNKHVPKQRRHFIYIEADHVQVIAHALTYHHLHPSPLSRGSKEAPGISAALTRMLKGIMPVSPTETQHRDRIEAVGRTYSTCCWYSRLLILVESAWAIRSPRRGVFYLQHGNEAAVVLLRAPSSVATNEKSNRTFVEVYRTCQHGAYQRFLSIVCILYAN